MAIYTYICTILVPKRCMRPIPSAFTPRKLVHTALSLHSYGAAPPKFYAEGCTANPATQTRR